MTDPLIKETTISIATSPSLKKDDTSILLGNSFSSNEGNTEHNEQQHPTVNGGGNVFFQLFQRKGSKEDGPFIKNSDIDSLGNSGRPATDESDTTTQDDEDSSCAYSQDRQNSHDEMDDGADDNSDEGARNYSDDGSSDSDEDKETSEEEEENVESFHEDSKYQKGSTGNRQYTAENFDNEFGDINKAVHATYNGTEGGELYSLIAGTNDVKDTRIGTGNTGIKLGSTLYNFLKVNQKQQQKKERRCLLLVGNYTDDENDSRRSDGTDDGLPTRRPEEHDYTDFKEGNDFENRSAYHDDDDDDDFSETGEYRLECFYPGTDTNRQTLSEEGPHSESQDLHGRIHGFGNEDSMPHQGINIGPGPGRPFYADAMTDIPMTSMNMESSEERGLFTGVGKAMSSITDYIQQQRAGGKSTEKDRRRMLDYIHELEYSLDQKDKEKQLWKERAEKLMLEVDRLQGVGTDNNDDEELTDSNEDTEAEDNSEEMAKSESTPIKLRGCKTDDTVPEEEEGTTTKEGTLIDISPKPLVFDPLAAPTRNLHQQY